MTPPVTPERRQASPGIDEARLEAILEAAVEKGVTRAFVTLGVDILSADGVSSFHKRTQFIDKLMQEAQDGKLEMSSTKIGVLTAFVSAVVSAAVTRLSSWTPPTPPTH